MFSEIKAAMQSLLHLATHHLPACPQPPLLQPAWNSAERKKKREIRKRRKRRRKSPFGCPLQGSPQQIISLHLTSVPLHHLLPRRATLFPPSLPSINLLFGSPPAGLLPAVPTFLHNWFPNLRLRHVQTFTVWPPWLYLRNIYHVHDPPWSLPKERFTLISAVPSPTSCLHLSVSSLDSITGLKAVLCTFLFCSSWYSQCTLHTFLHQTSFQNSLLPNTSKFLLLLDVDSTCSLFHFMQLEFALLCSSHPPHHIVKRKQTRDILSNVCRKCDGAK